MYRLQIIKHNIYFELERYSLSEFQNSHRYEFYNENFQVFKMFGESCYLNSEFIFDTVCTQAASFLIKLCHAVLLYKYIQWVIRKRITAQRPEVSKCR